MCPGGTVPEHPVDGTVRRTSGRATVGELLDGTAIVTLRAQDDVSGVSDTQYRINAGPWTSGNVISLLTDGTDKVEYQSTDVARNVEHVRSTGDPPVSTRCRGHCGP